MPDIYEIVNSTQLNSDLEDVADAIRAKSAGQSPLLFPSEFISEIGSIPTGASITGAVDISGKAIENITIGNTLMIYRQYDRFLTNYAQQQVNYLDVSPDGSKIITCSSVNTNIFSFGTPIWNLTQLQGNIGAYKYAKWSPDGTKLALLTSSGNKLRIFDATSFPITQIVELSPSGTPYRCAWSPDGSLVAVAHNTSPFITIYDTTTWTALASPATLPPSTGNDCQFSPDGKYLAVAHNNSPYITIYDTSTTPFSKIANPNYLPTGNGACCSWNHAGTLLAVGHNTSPYITVYDTSTTPYTIYTNMSTADNPGASCGSISWAGDDSTIAATASGKLYLYDATVNPLTRINGMNVMPSGNFCEIFGNDKYIAAANGDNVPKLSIYNIGSTLFEKHNNTLEKQLYAAYGYAKQIIASGSTGTASVVFVP